MQLTMKHLFTSLLLLCATAVAAHDFETGGIYYNILSETDKTVEVTYIGKYYSSYPNEYTGSVVIPESVTYNGTIYSVTSIGYGAFGGCTGLTSITIPNSITSIGEKAFYGCTGLTSIIIPNSITSIGDAAFYGCKGLTSITIPNSVTSIGDEAFYGCSSFTSIEIPNSVTSIGNYAFGGCTGLTSATIGNSVTSIGNSAFAYCTELTSVTIPNSVTSIGDEAFYGCAGLTSITIPNSVTSIGNYAFYDCYGLTNIEIPNSVTNIGERAFYGCKGLTSITIPNSVTSIGYAAFGGCTGLTSVTIPNSVTSIGYAAFCNCKGLTNIIVESGNMYYDSRDNCNAIIETATNTLLAGCQKTIIPNDVTSIGNYAFWGCTGLTSVEIPNSVTSIGNYAFTYCTGLTSVTIGNSVTSIGYDAFRDCTGLKTVINFSNLTFSEGSEDYGYIAHYADKVYNAPNGSIEGDFIFGKPNEVNTLVGYLGNATELTLPADYKGDNYVIGADAFSGCTGLTSIEIPNSVTSIGYSAFSGCTGLKTVLNFSNLTFSKGSSSNGYVAYYATKVINAPNAVIDGDFIWCKLNGENTLACYLGEVAELTLPSDYNGGNYVIGNDAFLGCTGLTSIEIPNSVTSIRGSAFSGCTGLTSIEIPNSVTSIRGSAFSGCTGLTSIEIPNSVTSIGSSAFSGCSNLETLYISNTIESIGDYAFAECNNILDIKTGSKKAITASENVFSSDAYNNACLHVPEGRKFAYEETAPWNKFYIVEMDFTGIDKVKAENGKVKTVYDLQGRKVENPTNGVYIINGKKVIVK